MSKNKKSNKKEHQKTFGDVTIHDFANSAVCKNRAKKSNNSVTTVIKRLEIDKNWDEKEDFEDDFNFVQKENEDGTVSVVVKKVESPFCKVKVVENDYQIGNDYPLDIWFLISEYLRPEDVGRFARICRTSFSVVCTAKFWFGLYKRYYKSVPTLPERLQPECMLRLYGLRTSVIRSLHYMYPLFVNRLKAITRIEEHPVVLTRRLCVLMWHQKCKSNWVYYFKLKENVDNTFPHCQKSEVTHKPDLIEMLEDVSANPDENCRVLQVTCLQYIAMPSIVLGLTLTNVALTLAQGFLHHRLQLGFGSGIQSSYCKSAGGSNSTTIILDPVINVKVLDWWHPLYPHPHNYNIDLLLNQE